MKDTDKKQEVQEQQIPDEQRSEILKQLDNAKELDEEQLRKQSPEIATLLDLYQNKTGGERKNKETPKAPEKKVICQRCGFDPETSQMVPEHIMEEFIDALVTCKEFEHTFNIRKGKIKITCHTLTRLQAEAYLNIMTNMEASKHDLEFIQYTTYLNLLFFLTSVKGVKGMDSVSFLLSDEEVPSDLDDVDKLVEEKGWNKYPDQLIKLISTTINTFNDLVTRARTQTMDADFFEETGTP